ncbi:importin subunit alpha-4 [Anaeramoeba flamelloides]|uniref:Importin subunit alpha n=1 Tax=Anaeramoeba flamelloides TaxID=1746091 RepID=A0AAV7YTU5_9EUKA|nr:importin subunit alpha-4 [Anaeramoeba flamelloides]
MSKFQKKLERRKSGFKKKVDRNTSSKRRERRIVSLSRKTRQENLSKRRISYGLQSPLQTRKPKQTINYDQMTQQVPQLIRNLQSNDLQKQKQTLTKIGEFLSQKKSPTKLMFEQGILEILKEILVDQKIPELIPDSIKLVGKFCSLDNEETSHIVKAGFVNVLMEYLEISNTDSNLVENILICLGNIILDKIEYRDQFLESDYVPRILDQFENFYSLNLLPLATWTILNLCKRRPTADFSYTQQLIPIFVELLDTDERKTLKNVCNGLSYLSKQPENHAVLVEFGAIKKLIELLSKDKESGIYYSLLVLNNFACGDESQLQELINLGILENLYENYTNSTHTRTKMQILLILSNLCCGNDLQLENIIESEIIFHVMEISKSEKFPKELIIETAWVLHNCFYSTNAGLIKSLIDIDGLGYLIKLVENHHKDPDFMEPCLIAIEKIMKNFPNKVLDIIENSNVLELLEKLQNSKYEITSEYSEKIIQNYYEMQEKMLEKDISSNTNTKSEYKF